MEKMHLLHVHVFRQSIKLACRVPRLDHQDVSAFGSGYRLVKGRAGRRAYLNAIKISLHRRNRRRIVLDAGIHPERRLHIVTIIRSGLIDAGVACTSLGRTVSFVIRLYAYAALVNSVVGVPGDHRKGMRAGRGISRRRRQRWSGRKQA